MGSCNITIRCTYEPLIRLQPVPALRSSRADAGLLRRAPNSVSVFHRKCTSKLRAVERGHPGWPPPTPAPPPARACCPSRAPQLWGRARAVARRKAAHWQFLNSPQCSLQGTFEGLSGSQGTVQESCAATLDRQPGPRLHFDGSCLVSMGSHRVGCAWWVLAAPSPSDRKSMPASSSEGSSSPSSEYS